MRFLLSFLFTSVWLLSHYSICQEHVKSLVLNRVNRNRNTSKPTAEFESFKVKYSRKYKSSAHLAKAQENYLKNIARIRAHNENNSSSYEQGENLMTDLSYEEVIKTRTGHRRRRSHNETAEAAIRGIHRVNEAPVVNDSGKKKQKQQTNSTTKQTKTTKTIKTTKKMKTTKRTIQSKGVKAASVKSTSSQGSLDLRSDFPPVQYQGECGSCWSFTATALVDNYSYKLGKKIKYSEQYMLDCSGSGDCAGGDQDTSLYWSYENGQATQDDYGKYLSADKSCKSSIPHKFKISNACIYYPGDEGKLHYILTRYKVGVGVSIHVQESFISYSKGVYDDSTCPNAVNTNNHAVVVVGYGYDAKYKKPYWIVRNHWASSWGEGGYMRMVMWKNMCGVGNDLSFVC